MAASDRPRYLAVFGTFARNSLVRDMTFRWNFVLDAVSSLSWVFMQLIFFQIIFSNTDEIGANTGWHRWEFYIFLATMYLVNSLVEAFFMPNTSEFSELIRSGNLDFALLKPIDTQFLISLQKIEWSSLTNTVFALGLLTVSLGHLTYQPSPGVIVLYFFYVGCGVALLYSLMIVLGAISVWLGRNESLYDFWFYITNFSRYPMEIYEGPIGTPLRRTFTYLIPILVVVNVPARLLAKPLADQDWRLAGFGLAATISCFLVSRRLFHRALESYRSASS